MCKVFFFCILNLSIFNLFTQTTPFEKSKGLLTATYTECVLWYQQLAKKDKRVKVKVYGKSDAGLLMYVAQIGKPGKNKLNLLINNNIHPGEPEGTDASMLFIRNLLSNKLADTIFNRICLHIILQYNVDGTCNRSCCSRANQNGPSEVGFRANSLNLDLNRDFFKMDSKAAQNWVAYFVKNNFHCMVDNHTSNGADYAYTLTSFVTHFQKINPALKSVVLSLNKHITTNLQNKGIPNVPYVELYGETPNQGIMAFWETARYATGFAALHHCLGFTVETHMLKPFNLRVEATLAYLNQWINSIYLKKDTILNSYNLANSTYLQPKSKVYTNWQLDTTLKQPIQFFGYKASYIPSKVTNGNRLFYNKNFPDTFTVPYYYAYKPTDSVLIPKAFIIPQAWDAVIKRLKSNNIQMFVLATDTVLAVTASYIKSLQTVQNPYEGHYLHTKIKATDTVLYYAFKKGDWYISTQQPLGNLLTLTLSLSYPDNFMAWNFFDGILMQKEYFSGYVFEDVAESLLKSNIKLKQNFDLIKGLPAFKNNPQAQLDYIYSQSEYYEKSHKLYPVFKFN